MSAWFEFFVAGIVCICHRWSHRTTDGVTEALDSLLVNLVGAFDAAARVAHLTAGLDPAKRHRAAWQNSDWRKMLGQPQLSDLFVNGSHGADLYRVCRILRNTVHGEGLQGSGCSVGGKAVETRVALPEDDAADCTALLGRLGGSATWGLHSFGTTPQLDAATFVERLILEALALLDDVLRLTSVERLSGININDLLQGPPNSLDFGLGARVRSCLFHGLPPPST